MAYDRLVCKNCGADVTRYRNPFPTVDIIIELDGKIALIRRKNSPLGWALPGGFVDYGESLEDAAVREAAEETSLKIGNLKLLGCYSDPARDSRMHTITTVFVASGAGTPMAADDAAGIELFEIDRLPEPLCFDHARILADYMAWRSLRLKSPD